MAEKYSLNVVYGVREGHLLEDGRISYGGNSGHQAIHLAYNLGAAKIMLLGYDFGGKNHWFGEHPRELNAGHNYAMWLTHIAQLAEGLKGKGVEVINYTRSTAIDCFQRGNLDA